MRPTVIMELYRNNSGQGYLGDLDYGIHVASFEKLSIRELYELEQILEFLQQRCFDRAETISLEKNVSKA